MAHVDGDPNFTIASPAASQTLGSKFSVYGTCSNGTTGIVAYVGAYNASASISPSGTSWEAIFTNIPNGSYGVYATCSGNGRTPASPNSIAVTVQGIAGLTVNNPSAPSPGVAGGSDNPWDGWQVEGGYKPGSLAGMMISLTQYGVPVIQSSRNPQRISIPVTFHQNNSKWGCGLTAVPATYVGSGFCIHYSTTVGGTQIQGSGTGFFSGPTSPSG